MLKLRSFSCSLYSCSDSGTDSSSILSGSTSGGRASSTAFPFWRLNQVVVAAAVHDDLAAVVAAAAVAGVA